MIFEKKYKHTNTIEKYQLRIVTIKRWLLLYTHDRKGLFYKNDYNMLTKVKNWAIRKLAKIMAATFFLYFL